MTLAGQETTPDSVSPQLKLTVTFVLFQPAPLGAGDAEPLIVGLVLSILIGPKVEATAVLPALSAQVPPEVAVVPLALVCVVKFCTLFPEPEVRPLPPVSAHSNVTRTDWFVQSPAV